MIEPISITNFIKYCLGYIKLTTISLLRSRNRITLPLEQKYFDLTRFLQGELKDDGGEIVNLETFYKFDPKEVPEELINDYNFEKNLAKFLEELYNQYKNNEFTKQLNLNFGYFQIELPPPEDELAEEKSLLSIEQTSLFPEMIRLQPKLNTYPLFSIPVVIKKDNGKYFLVLVDDEIQSNLGLLEPILKNHESLYNELVDDFGEYEIDEKLQLPITSPQIFIELWHKVKEKLRLTKALFDENSFNLYEVRVTIVPKANYFVAQDLKKLAKLPKENLKKTSLMSWVDDTDLEIKDELPNEGDLYFPFKYNKYQLDVLSILRNKAAIVEGPPGTGKSETIANLLCHLSAKGKKVLFVSQKAQAIKVVKEKLKSTKPRIKYLFGYIPNPKSSQINEEDELDGVAPQLAGIGIYLNRLRNESFRFKDSIHDPNQIKEAVEEKTVNRNRFIESVHNQREYFRLKTELDGLSEFEFGIKNVNKYRDNFNESSIERILKLQEEVQKLNKDNEIYLNSNLVDKKKFDSLFNNLVTGQEMLSEKIYLLSKDLERKISGREFGAFLLVKILLHKIKNRNLRALLPNEILEYIDKELAKNNKIKQKIKTIQSLSTYCAFYERDKKVACDEQLISEWLESAGLSRNQFETIKKLLGNYSLDTVKENISKACSLKEELQNLNLIDPNETFVEYKRCMKTRKERVISYIQNIINSRLFTRYSNIAIGRTINLLARVLTKSKRAFKTFDRLKKDPQNFRTILDLIPVWMMELDDASRIIPFEAGLFDYVIFDESSQCNIAYALPAMYRSYHAIFFGDSEQMRDDTIRFKTNKSLEEIGRRYKVPDEMRIKSAEEPVKSVLDIASLRNFKSTPLLYHYRSPSELIKFSNDHFYTTKGKTLTVINSNYLTYGNSNRIMYIHKIQVDWNKEISDKINVSEAEKVIELLKEFKNDERYKDKTIGVLTFFNEQATLIRKYVEEEFGVDTDIKVSIIEGIQGDEKDIIIYSFVITSRDQKNRYVPLTGEGGDINPALSQGRVNVAFSRARLQTHCVTSMNITDIPEGIWIKKYLEYADKYGEIDFYSSDLKPFDSKFEEKFYYLAKEKLRDDYKLQNQVKSCGFKIDFVISNIRNGKKIAIECDGPTHFQDEIDEEYGIYIENDAEREEILRDAGWDFIRIKYTDWINPHFDKNKVINNIEALLQ